MSDFSNNSGMTGQSQDNTNENISPQNNSQYSNEVGTTYWEINGWQASNEPKEQFNSQGDQFNYTNENNFRQKKPKRKKPLIAAGIIIILLAILAVTALAFGDKIQNTLSIITKSPRDYYAYIENRSAEKAVDKLIAMMNMGTTDNKLAFETSAKLTYDKDTVGALIKSNTGMSIEDLEAALGISLDSIGFNINAASDDNALYGKIGVNLNNVDIITAEIFLDYVAKEMLTRLPDLSDAYLRQSLDMSELDNELPSIDLKDYSAFLNLLKSERNGNFLKHYIRLITEEIRDVKLSKGEILNVGDLSVEANLLSVSIYPEDIKNISVKILEEAKNDEFIMELCQLLDISKEDYKENIEEALENVKGSPVEDDDVVFIMDVYADNSGKILGRKIRYNEAVEDDSVIAYYYVEQSNKGAYEFYVNSDNPENSFRLSGNHTINDKSFTGEAVIDINSDLSSMSNISLEINYEDFKTQIKDNFLYLDGVISLSSYAMYGIDVELEFSSQGREQLTTLKLKMGNTSLVTFDTSTKYVRDFKMPSPDVNAASYDVETEINDYYMTFDVQKYLSDLSDRLDVDFGSLFSYFFQFGN